MKRYSDAELARTMRLDGRENLMQIRRAGAGIESIARVLDLTATGEVSQDGCSLEGYITGGLVDAMQELGCVIQEKTAEMFLWMAMDPCGRELTEEEVGAEEQQDELGDQRIVGVVYAPTREPGRAAGEG